jgi:hypothetical protein
MKMKTRKRKPRRDFESGCRTKQDRWRREPRSLDSWVQKALV